MPRVFVKVPKKNLQKKKYPKRSDRLYNTYIL